ncbi:cyclic-phosphate processing receiver domain-containing protein [Marinicrinis lubricantis]|uniref:Cyclic-phosphate processing receiver domain-containing protein n=1 Tax=Marinicrinis lubricantis TaxID=2086470 RepID=A0ABW1IU57_9BACL
MIHVYLDDFRPCPKGFVLAKNVEECLTLLKECEVDILSLDHDLGWGEPTGTELVRAMVARGLYGQRIYLHTSSQEGCRRMYEMLYQGKPDTVQLYPHAMPAVLIGEIAKAANDA